MSLLLIASLTGCSSARDPQPAHPRDPGPQDPAPAQAGLPPPPTAAALLAAADARTFTPAIRAGLVQANPDTRRTAMIALGRLHTSPNRDLSEPVTRALRRGLRDPDPAVRAAASMGLGAVGSPGADAALAAALAAEVDHDARTWLVRDLGRVGTDAAVRAVASQLNAEAPEVQAAACLALAERGARGLPVAPSIRSRIVARLTGATEPVRFACLHTLGRLPAPLDDHDAESARAESVAAAAAVTDESARVRALAYRALGRSSRAPLEMIMTGTRDADWRVQVQAFRALGQRVAANPSGVALYAAALRRSFADTLEDPSGPDRGVRPGPPLHVFLTATANAGALASLGPIHDLAAELYQALGQLGSSPDRDRAHCATAELVDRGRGWPSRVSSCGGESTEPETRLALEARVLGVLEGAEAQRVARLARLLDSSNARVREAALAAAARIVDAGANELILTALGAHDAGVRAAALEALTAVASRRPSAERVPPPVPPERAREGLRTLRANTPDGELETLIGLVAAIEAVDARELEDVVAQLAGHQNAGVRARAREVLTAWGVPAPTGHDPVPNPVDPSQLASDVERPRVQLETSRGTVVLELRPDEAPVTALRFTQLVREGFYDGLTFHRVVPGFVVQGGDPRGDGFGGPGWAQRCEDNRLPYQRGTVGMALSGRDTGGSQFFITYGPTPHLEGRYTAFGAVVQGMDIVDELQQGDRIIRATSL